MTPTEPEPSFTDPGDTAPDPLLAPHYELTALVMEASGTVKEHDQQIGRLETAVEALNGVLDRIAALETVAPGPAPTTAPPTNTGEQPPSPPRPTESAGAVFDLRVLLAWVRENVATMVEREIPASRSPNWCRQWWRHSEAIARLEAARRCWLDASSEATGLSAYFQHLDHHLGVLMGEGGPFSRCRDGQHTTDPIATRRLGQDEPAETFYLEFDRARAAAIPTGPTRPTRSRGEHHPGPAPVGSATGGVRAGDLAQRRNGRGR